MQQVRPEETVLDLHGLDYGENDVLRVSLETGSKLVRVMTHHHHQPVTSPVISPSLPSMATAALEAALRTCGLPVARALERVVTRGSGSALTASDAAAMLRSRGDDTRAVLSAATWARDAAGRGDATTFVVNRNINFTVRRTRPPPCFPHPSNRTEPSVSLAARRRRRLNTRARARARPHRTRA